MSHQKKPPVCLYYGEDLARYGFGAGHPFGADRLSAFWDEAQRRGIPEQLRVVAPVSTDRRILERFHSRAYIDRMVTQSETGEGSLDYGDTPAFVGVHEAVCFVVGSVLDAARRIMADDCRRAFVPIAGLHHARRDSAAGFCAVNDCGVLIETLLNEPDPERIAYVDIDAHHGDGVFYGFEDDPRVIFADIHEDGRYLYPGTGSRHETGTGDAKGTKLNLPLPPGADDNTFLGIWPQVEQHLRDHRPDFIVLQCGADSIAGDPITHLQFSSDSHAHAAARLCELADELCAGRLLALGGGGYNRGNLARGWNAVVEAFIQHS